MKCRLCGNNIETPFLELGNQPLSNSFISKEDLYKKEEYYPLNVYVCGNCKLVQVDEFVESDKIFKSGYPYFSSYSSTWVKHCKNYVDMIVKRLNLNEKSRILEIGCNDGCLLNNFKRHNINDLIGVEPSIETADVAISKGLNMHKFMFDSHYVKDVIGNPVIDLIIGNNVLAHNPNLNEFVQSLKYILAPNGTITIEFPWLLNLIKNNQFDTVYHEHFSYFSLHTVQKLLMNNGLCIYDVEEISTHGGSLRIYIKHYYNLNNLITENVHDKLNEEIKFGLNKLLTYDKFSKQVIQYKKEILQFILKISNKKVKIIGYSAPAKANTILNYCGIGKEFIDYIVDISPHKQGKYLPGTHIPIYGIDKIKETKPDYIVIFAWNIKDEIIEQLKYTKGWNCKLIILNPKIEIVQ